MEKKIHDFLPFYIGSECQLMGEVEDDYADPVVPKIFTLTGITIEEGTMFCHCIDAEYYHQVESTEIFPILRKLDSMTEEEMLEYGKCIESLEDCDNAEFTKAGSIKFSKNGFPKGHLYPNEYNTAESFRYLLSKHFDLFSLVESGLALDKNNLKD